MNISPLFKRIQQVVSSTTRGIIPLVSVTNTSKCKLHYMCNMQQPNLCTNVNTINNTSKTLLQPFIPMYNVTCGIKVRGRIELRCKDCYYVRRAERLYVMCKTHPRHKQTQMKKRDYKTWIVTHASQSKLRPW